MQLKKAISKNFIDTPFSHYLFKNISIFFNMSSSPTTSRLSSFLNFKYMDNNKIESCNCSYIHEDILSRVKEHLMNDDRKGEELERMGGSKRTVGSKIWGDCKQGLLNEKLILFLILLEY